MRPITQKARGRWRPPAVTWTACKANLLGACLVLLASCGCASSLNHVVERDLRSLDDTTCHGYLAWQNPNVDQVFLMVAGTGVYSHAFLHPSVKKVVRRRSVAYLTFDKPGIRAPFGDPGALQVDDAQLSTYTQGHLLACAEDAFDWAHETFGPQTKVHLRGHSEGTLISLFLYDRLLRERADAADDVASIVLSGVGLEPFEDIVERQLDTWPNEHAADARDALQHCDWPRMKKYFGVSCAYLQDAYRRPSGRSMFERLAAQRARAPFFLFHGNDDWATPASFVRELQAWNERDRRLDMSFVFYEGGHLGSPTARREMASLLDALTAKAGSGVR